MRRLALAIIAAGLAALAGPASAQAIRPDEDPGVLLGRVIATLEAPGMCGFVLAPADRDALTGARDRLAQDADFTADEVAEVGEEAKDAIRNLSCDRLREGYADGTRQLLDVLRRRQP